MSRRDEYLQKQRIQKSINMATDTILSTLTVVLKKEFDFGPKRIHRILQSIEKEVAPIGSGMIGYEDYKQYAEEFTGVSISAYTEK